MAGVAGSRPVIPQVAPLERRVAATRFVRVARIAGFAWMIPRVVPPERQGSAPNPSRTVRRSRDHVAARRPRIRVDRAEHERVLERFVAAMNSGEVQELMDVLAPDVVAVADGGGQVRGAARRPIVGADAMVRYLLGGLEKYGVRFVMSPMWLNGEPGVRVEVDGELVAAVSISVEQGRVARILSIANPEKLAHLDAEMALTR